MKVIMILTNRFDPDVRVYKEARYLVEMGNEVEILCWDRENEYINKENELYDGIKIKRFFPYSRYGSGIKQIIPYFKYIFRCKKYLSKFKYDYLHCHDLDGMIAGYIIGCKKLIFDMHEYYEIQKTNRFYRRIIRIIVNYLQKIAHGVIYVNETQIENVNKAIIGKCKHLPNYPDMTNFQNVIKTESKKLRISYIGVVGQYQQLKNLMDACDSIEGVEISIHGNGTALEKLREIENNYNNVHISGKYSFKDSERLYNDTDLHYIVYSMKNFQNRISEPIKFYESIITRTPIIANKDSKIGNFIENYKIGFTVDGDEVSQIRNLVLSVINNRNYLNECDINLKKIQFDYSWSRVVKILDSIYK